MATSSRIMHHVTKLESFQIGFLNLLDDLFNVLTWPTQSPDLNPIKHLWDVVERELCGLDVQPRNVHQLQDAIYQYGPTFLKNAFSTLLSQCHVELRQF